MSTLREAAQQALEALEQCGLDDTHRSYEFEHMARIALRAALAQQEQEPVAWRSQNATPPGGFVIFQQYPQALADLGGEIEPLYTHPPCREWRGLTDDEISALFPLPLRSDYKPYSFARAIEAALKEKNNG